MNFKKWTTALMLALAVSSCIQDEALNSEAAIDACTGADVQLAHINSDSKEINIYVHKGANLAKQQLLFTLPDGATIKADEHSPNDILNNYDFSIKRDASTPKDVHFNLSFSPPNNGGSAGVISNEPVYKDPDVIFGISALGLECSKVVILAA